MHILADVAPYSREYNTFRQIVGKQAQGNTELEIEYEKILNRVKRTRESVIRMNDRHFTRPVDEISGTVEEVSPGGITLKEFPGRVFQFSSVSTSAADMSARILGENNNMTRCLHPDGQQNPRARDRPKPVHKSGSVSSPYKGTSSTGFSCRAGAPKNPAFRGHKIVGFSPENTFRFTGPFQTSIVGGTPFSLPSIGT